MQQLAKTEAVETTEVETANVRKSGEYKVTAPKADNRSVVVTYDYPETAQECIDKFGDDVVLSGFKGKDVVTLQAKVRKAIEAGSTDEECQTIADIHVPGVSAPRGSGGTVNKSNAKTWFQALSPEEKAEFLNDPDFQ